MESHHFSEIDNKSFISQMINFEITVLFCLARASKFFGIFLTFSGHKAIDFTLRIGANKYGNISQETTSFSFDHELYLLFESVWCRYQVQKSFMIKFKYDRVNQILLQYRSNFWARNFSTTNRQNFMKLWQQKLCHIYTSNKINVNCHFSLNVSNDLMSGYAPVFDPWIYLVFHRSGYSLSHLGKVRWEHIGESQN